MPKIKVHFEHTLHFIKEMEITQEELNYLTGNGELSLTNGQYHELYDSVSLDQKIIEMIKDTEMDEAEDCTIETEQVFVEEIK